MARKSMAGNSNYKHSATKAQTRKLPSEQSNQNLNTTRRNLVPDRPKTSPDLFLDATTTSMASALPIWEASNIFTQRNDLPWRADPNGKLHYAREVENGKGAVYFWVTEDLKQESPATLAGAAALAVISAFDIRAACMHLIYAAHAMQLERPWEQEFVIDNRQIEDYLGLRTRTDRNKQQKLALIREIVQQPCKITTFISWPAQGKRKGFTIEEGRLWHMQWIRDHYEQDLSGNEELIGVSCSIRAGSWAKYFLNEEGRRDLNAFFHYDCLNKALLEDIMSLWHHREGAVRLMVWLLPRSKADRQYSLGVQTLLEIAYGTGRIEQARQSSQLRKRLANTWDEDLLALHDRGWHLHFHSETYSPELQPLGFGRGSHNRPKGFFEQLLLAQIWISPPDNWSKEAILLDGDSKLEVKQAILQAEDRRHNWTGVEVRARRQEKGWSQPRLSMLSGLSQSLIWRIENQERSITSKTQEILDRTFALHN